VSESEGKIQIVNDLMSNLPFNQNTSETTHSQRKVIYLFLQKKSFNDFCFIEEIFKTSQNE
jgi:hypothetical protein